MAGPTPSVYKTGDLKSKLLNLAQTSVYKVEITPPNVVPSDAASQGTSCADFINIRLQNKSLSDLTLLCQDASLPGSSFATHDVTNDYQGVRERMAYRRTYDDTIDLTFYVDNNYDIINWFQGWMEFVQGYSSSTTLNQKKYSRRTAHNQFRYYNEYVTDNLYVTKFEKGDTVTTSITYQFIGAFPINLIQVPISYEQSDILRVTVSIAYSRYISYMNYQSVTEGGFGTAWSNFTTSIGNIFNFGGNTGASSNSSSTSSLGANEVYYQSINGVEFGRDYWQNAIDYARR